MKKQIIFWSVATLIVLCFSFSSCGKIKNEEENKFNVTYLSGEWHFFSGSLGELIGESSDDIYDQILTFTSVGNYSEKNIFADKDEKLNGNWTIQNNQITLNDWDGKPLNNPVTLIGLSENRLEISYHNSKSVYLRVGTEFENLKTNILGYWKVFPETKYKTNYQFKNDGTVTYTSQFSEQVFTVSNYEWKVEGNLLTLTLLPTHSLTDKYSIKYCNDKYMRWQGGFILKR